MYSNEDKTKAIQQLIKNDGNYAKTIVELGYPSRYAIISWHKEYLQTGKFKPHGKTGPKGCNYEKKSEAVKYYLEHGKSLKGTIRALGYSSHQALANWIDELAPGQRRTNGANFHTFTSEVQEKAVLELNKNNISAKDIATDINVTTDTLYTWRQKLLAKEETVKSAHLPNSLPDKLPDNPEEAARAYEDLKKLALRYKLEGDIFREAQCLSKKAKGVDPKSLKNQEKARIIDALKNEYGYREKPLLQALHIAKSSYHYQVKALKTPDKYIHIRNKMQEIFHKSYDAYGYRRIHAALNKEGIFISSRVVIRLMHESNLKIKKVSTHKYNSYKGELTDAPPNILKRNFRASAPNQKWVTDITEFNIPVGKIYLSPIMDCFDGYVVSWTIGISPNANLVNTMLEDAISTLKNGERPIVNSDRGCHYRWPGWINLMDNNGLVRSMSRKGCSPDNAAAEGLFGRLKNEFFYGKNWSGVTAEQFIDLLNQYIRWYNEKRIKVSLGNQSPLEYRRALSFVA